MLRLLFLLAALLLGGIAVVQVAPGQTATVQGTVRDDSGATLPGVNVVLLDTPFGAATDADGVYRIVRIPAGTYVVRASAVGFEAQQRSVTLTPGETATLDFVLRETAFEGGEVVVTASRRPQRFTEAPVSISVVRTRELEARNIVALDQALRYVPGVQMADNQVNVRGSSGFSFNTGSRVLLLLDGIPLLAPDREAIPSDALPISQIERIEVVKGPGSALYGSGALGGVINVITKDFPDVPMTTLRLFGGVYEPFRYAEWRSKWEEADQLRPYGGGTLTHARAFGEKGGFWASVSYREDRGFVNFRAERDLDAFVKVGWRPRQALRLDLLGGWTWRKSDSFLYWNGLSDPLNPGALTLGTLDARGTNDTQTSLITLAPSFTHILSGTLSYSIKARLIGALIQPLNDDGSPKPLAEGTIGLRYGGEAQLTWLARGGLQVIAGVTGDALATESSFFQPDSVDATARSQPERAAFVQAEQRLGRLTVVAGLRYDTYEIDTTKVERKLSPKLNLSFPLADVLTLRAAYGQGFRVPSLGERFVNNSAFLPIIPNLDLKPEESTSYEVGLRAVAPLSRRLRAQGDVALFWNDYRRLVEPTFIPEEQAFQFRNLTRARIRGMEASLDAATDDGRWSAGASYTFLDADDLTTGEPLVLRSRHLFKAGATVPLFGPFSAGLDVRFASAPERVNTDFSRFVPDARTIIDQQVFDFRLHARWTHVVVSLLVDNALDYYYVERPAIMAPPRHFTLQLQIDV